MNGVKLTYAYKCVMLGDSGCGKSSILLRQIHNQFSETKDSTIGAAFFTLIRNMNDCKIRLEVWDTAGQERYGSLIDMYLRNADIILLVYDVTDVRSFNNLTRRWLPYLKEKEDMYPENAVKILIANKIDLYLKTDIQDDNIVSNGEELAKTNGFSFYQTSAKANIGINHMFEYIFSELATGQHKPTIKSMFPDLIKLNPVIPSQNDSDTSKKKCCST